MFNSARGTDDNYDGYLCSNVNDYMPVLEPEFVEMNMRLDADKHHWEREAEKSDDERVKQTEMMVEYLSNLRTTVLSTLKKEQHFTRKQDLRYFTESTELIDMELFGVVPEKNKVEFRWGTLE